MSDAAKRVCLLSAEYPPARGGVGDYTQQLARALLAEGYACRVLTGARADALAEDPEGVPADARVARWDFSSWGTVLEALRRRGPDVLHIQYQTAAYGMHPAINLLPLRLRAAGWRGRVVTTFHDLRPPYLFPKAGVARHLPALTLAASSHAVVLVADEHRVEAPLAWLGRLRPSQLGKVTVIPIGSNIPRLPPAGYDRGAWRRRLGVADHEPLLVYFGFINESKGVEELLDALRRLRQTGVPANLLMVGGRSASNAADRRWQNRAELMVERLDLAAAVIWTGYAPAEEVSANLLAADLCVLPFRDGATFQRGTLLAALAHGLPVVSTAPPPAGGGSPGVTEAGAPRLAHGENVWLVPPRDPAALAEAVARLWGRPETRAALGRGARRLADLLSWPAIAARHRQLYEALWQRT